MENRHFNLVTDPWIKVTETESTQTRTVSLIELFEHAQDYRQLAGEMRSQDLAILRLLLAILTTVYSRVDECGVLYSWLEERDNENSTTFIIDEDEYECKGSKTLLETWGYLYQSKHFSKSVTQYLDHWKDRFDFFGNRPFYQVTATDYDALVPQKKWIATGKGQVAVKQINRQISESGNSPAIFSPKAGNTKNIVQFDELVRWLIMYQNFSGTSDKTKIVMSKELPKSPGWLYSISPVYIKGQNLFETLMLNLVLFDPHKAYKYYLQMPVWEYSTVSAYVKERKMQQVPNNLSTLYTIWSRLLHLEWDKHGQLQIFSAGLPMFEKENMLLEPMTTWRLVKKTGDYDPVEKNLSSLGVAMWRDFGQYVKTQETSETQEPGSVVWLRKLKDENLIDQNLPIVLNSVVLISSKIKASRSPVAELTDDFQLQAGVLFASEIADYWPVRIENTIKLTQTIGRDYYNFARDIGQIRNVDVQSFANAMSSKFYDRLNDPFKEWLEGLTGQDDRNEKINQWKITLIALLNQAVNDILRSSSPRDIKGVTTDKGPLNIFTAKNRLMYNVQLHLKKG